MVSNVFLLKTRIDQHYANSGDDAREILIAHL